MRTDMSKAIKSGVANMWDYAKPRVFTVCQYTESISWIERRNCAGLAGSRPNFSKI